MGALTHSATTLLLYKKKLAIEALNSRHLTGRRHKAAKLYSHHQVLIRRQPQPLGHSTHFAKVFENQKYKLIFFGRVFCLGNFYFGKI